MGRLLTKKLYACGDNDYIHYCEGCGELHYYPCHGDNPPGKNWTFNGNADMPSFSPSMNIGPGRCHYYLTGGMLMYCGDSQHKLANKTVPLPDLPDWFIRNKQLSAEPENPVRGG